MSKLTRDLAGSAAANTPLHPRENNFRANSILASASADTAIAGDAAGTFVFSVTAIGTQTLVVEGSIDGTNFYALPFRPYNAASVQWVVSTTTVGQFVGANLGFTQIRVRCSAFTSGSATFSISCAMGNLDQTLQGKPATLAATTTAATGVAATLTIAAPGAGLRQYLTALRIERHTSALLTAGATPTVITTTNLPGSLAFSIPADAAAQGVVYAMVENWGADGLAASAQNTAVTIVAGAVTGVIWRITAYYRVAP